MSNKYKFKETNGAYFISFATINWIDVFTRDEYFWIVIESLDFCRKNKSMEIYGYCIMSNHIHLIFRFGNGDPSGLMRDFKGFTSKKLLKAIIENPQESRKEWMLWMMQRAGKKNSNVKNLQFWQQDNHPIEIWSLTVFEQKLKYIHQNPVKSGFVIDAVDWKYSSARNYSNNDHTILEIHLN
ncbi:REP element-mobilizing transposase RayT [Flavobacterium sp. 90]|uniref:REP-associated tyrosine transposase n=1 Tax=unclassified Flavobacterium TaxID=196869 RepID=UPI000EAC1323|nr:MULTISPECIES: transposase [unclassified Flavobacterium]RKR06002.1 REP element-mobilizing transposase RayT [Flavobacterium sp. 81]TCK57310.1 REP element-mobilizing transposase RayT [Flavobacterium sp. 90]